MRRAFLFVFFTAILCGCGPQHDPRPTSGTSSGNSGKKLRIAVIPKGTSHQFWKSVHAGAKQKAAELKAEGLDVEVLWQGPASEGDVIGQGNVVQQMLLAKVDGIVLAPNDSKALVKYVKEANLDNVPVVIFDSGLGEGAEIVSYVATDNENGGRFAAKSLAEAMGEKGNVILLRYHTGSESTEMREEGFLEEIANHPDIKVLSSDQYAETSEPSSLEKAQQLLLKYKEEVNGIFAVCEPNANGTLKALQEAGLAGKVKFIAFDPSEKLIAGLRTGEVHGIVLQDPVRMGYLSVETMVNHLQGKPVEKRVPTGEYVATKETMDTAEMQKLLLPPKE